MVCYSPAGYIMAECPHMGLAWVPLGCRDCDGCREFWRAKTVARILHGLEGEKWVSFVTLTSVPGATWPEIMRAWGKMAQWLRRSHGLAGYVAVKEVGSKTEMKHLHLICTGWQWVDVRLLSTQWRKYSGASIVWVKRVRSSTSGRVANYVAKYVSKGLGSMGWRKLVTFSVRWPKLPKLSTDCSYSWFPRVTLKGTVGTDWGYRVVGWGYAGPCECFGPCKAKGLPSGVY